MEKKALPEPIILTNYFENNSSDIEKRRRKAFLNYNPNSFTSEDEMKNHLIETVLSNLGWKAERMDYTRIENGSPDIWVYKKNETPKPFILIEGIEKCKTENKLEKEFNKRKERKYKSESGLWFITDGCIVDVLIGEIDICRINITKERGQQLFVTALNPNSPLLDKAEKFSKAISFDEKIEQHIAKTIQIPLKKQPNLRPFFVLLLVQAVLEHNNYIDTEYIFEFANLNEQSLLKKLLELLDTDSTLKSIDDIKEVCKKNFNSLNSISDFIKTIITYKNKPVCFKDLDAFSFSKMYEESFSPSERKKYGIYTTPKSACLKITQKAYFNLTTSEILSSRNKKIIISDVSCGSGNFLESAIDVICSKVDYGKNKHSETKEEGIERRKSYEYLIRGQDVNIEAVTFAETSVLLSLAKRKYHPEFKEQELNIKFEFSCGDSTKLTTPIYQDNNCHYLMYLGNPPYVKQTKSSLSIQSKKEGKKNLGTLIIEAMLGAYNNERCTLGILYQVALIGSQSNKIQEILDKKSLSLSTYINFGVSKMFTSLSAQKWAGIIWGIKQEEKFLIKIDSVEFPKKFIPNIINIEERLVKNIEEAVENNFDDDLKINNAESFSILVSHDKDLAKKIISLREEGLVVETGIQATCEFFEIKKVSMPCFQVHKNYFKNGQLNKLEKECLFPYWTNGYELDFYLQNSDFKIIDLFSLADKFITLKEKDKNLLKPDYIDVIKNNENNLIKYFPTLYKHLLPFKGVIQNLIDHHGRISPWWKLHRNRNSSIYKENKVVIPQMINFGYDVNFYIDNVGFGVPFNCNVIWAKEGYREDWKEALVGWLHSGVITLYFNAIGGVKPRGNGELTGELLKKIPLPKCIVYKEIENKSIENIVQNIINIIKAGYNKDTHIKLDKECANLLYQLTDTKEVEPLYREDWKKVS